MTQFKPYPIYIVYSKHNQDDAQGEASRFNNEARRLEREAKRLNSDALRLDSKKEFEWEKFVENTALTTEDSDPAYQREAEDYHKNILERLKKIQGVPFGKMLLGLFKSDVYIVPR